MWDQQTSWRVGWHVHHTLLVTPKARLPDQSILLVILAALQTRHTYPDKAQISLPPPCQVACDQTGQQLEGLNTSGDLGSNQTTDSVVAAWSHLASSVTEPQALCTYFENVVLQGGTHRRT